MTKPLSPCSFWSFLCTCGIALLISFPLSGQPLSPEASLNRAFEKGNLMVAISAQSWRPGLCMAAARVQTGKSVSLSLSLSARKSYTFISTAEQESTDVDLYLRDQDGKLIASDSETDGTPVIEFRVPETGNYQLQLHIPASDQGTNFVSLSLLESSGRQIIEEEYRNLTASFFASSEEIISAYPKVRWRSTINQWCLFGFSLDQKEGHTFQQLRLDAARYYFAAAGGPVCQNIDLYLANQKNEIVALDKAPDALPLLEYVSNNSQSCNLRIEVKRSSGPGFILLGLFHQ
ncbi:PPC domain-containing protein [Neolewinella agarilytica]|uniref:PPC domain-containing protein n=1 Tax=Neolewinella agarilytica TaxID=478744 RepID=UPI0023544B9D|nr:PPC domain-containing protein [Neolewinella agarilytica]